MDPNEIFKQFFGGSFSDFGHGHFGSGHRKGEGWSSDGHAGADVFGDWHLEMHKRMKEMDEQMKEVFRIFSIPDGFSVQALPDHSAECQPKSESSPRDQMLKDDKALSVPLPSEPSEPHAFSSPGLNFSTLSEWMDSISKLPRWNRIHPEEKVDRDLDSKRPSSAEIADLFKQEQESPAVEVVPAQPFSIRGNSVSIRTVIGNDGMVEERRTVRDSSGREETTITRRMGDSSHVITTIKDDQGREEKREIFNNVDRDHPDDFGQQWTGKGPITDPRSSVQPVVPGSGVLSDDTRGIFRKFFGF